MKGSVLRTRKRVWEIVEQASVKPERDAQHINNKNIPEDNFFYFYFLHQFLPCKVLSDERISSIYSRKG